MDTFPSVPNVGQVYVDAAELPEIIVLEEALRPGYAEYSFDIRSLTMDVDGSKFAISSETPSKFTLKSLDVESQDVMVEVQSVLFKIVDARRSRGITSQAFHVLKQNESMSFEIGYKDLSKISLENFNNVDLNSAAGYVTITQIKSFKGDDSDEQWGLDGENKKHLLARIVRIRSGYGGGFRDVADYGHWEEKLSAEVETEDVKRVKKLFAEAFLKKAQIAQAKIDEKAKNGWKMYTSPEDIQKEDEERKMKEEEKKKKQEEKDRLRRNKENMEEHNKKKEKKKCVIL